MAARLDDTGLDRENQDRPCTDQLSRIGESTLPIADLHVDDLEVKRIYLLHRFHGSGVGKRLMAEAGSHVQLVQAPRLLLGVYANNHDAIAFYVRQDFAKLVSAFSTSWQKLRRHDLEPEPSAVSWQRSCCSLLRRFFLDAVAVPTAPALGRCRMFSQRSVSDRFWLLAFLPQPRR